VRTLGTQNQLPGLQPCHSTSGTARCPAPPYPSRARWLERAAPPRTTQLSRPSLKAHGTRTALKPAPKPAFRAQLQTLNAENQQLRSINGVLDKVVAMRDEHIGGLQQALQVRGLCAGRAARGRRGVPGRCRLVPVPGGLC
jgi:hypothetical protein